MVSGSPIIETLCQPINTNRAKSKRKTCNRRDLNPAVSLGYGFMICHSWTHLQPGMASDFSRYDVGAVYCKSRCRRQGHAWKPPLRCNPSDTDLPSLGWRRKTPQQRCHEVSQNWRKIAPLRAHEVVVGTDVRCIGPLGHCGKWGRHRELTAPMRP